LDEEFYQSLEYDPEVKAKKLRAFVLVSEGEKIAKEGKLQESIAKFQEAKSLDDSLDFDPEQKAKPLVASFLVSEGEKLGRSGKLQESIAKFKQAKTLDDSLDFDPETKAKLLVAAGFVNQAAELMKEDNATEALAKYKKAQELDSNLETADKWDLNDLCRYGSLRGYAAEVMSACDMAVERASNHGGIRDSRGVARALTGDYKGSISDFEAYIQDLNRRIKETEDEESRKYFEKNKAQYQSWVDTLKKGENPFTEEVLQELLEE
jgi:tetratricopeptide (TPR) repeat protein